VCFCSFCYSEFASILPVEGSAYAYAYGTIGEIFAWIIGWGLILEYAMGSMTVAVAWSGYFNKLLKMFGLHLPDFLTSDPFSYAGEGFSMNLPALLIVLLVISILVKGTKELLKQ
jgi:APA family basic amino acid/polyamine antiporter